MSAQNGTKHILTLLIAGSLLAACAPAAAGTLQAAVATPTSPPAVTTAPPAYSASAIPLKDALGSLQPQDVFQDFYDITQVPRRSGHADQIRAFLVDFGRGLGLETVVDDAGNVLIRKPASAGMEDRSTVVLQAHMDMVAQAADGKDFDFDTDPIPAYVSGDYIITDGTTLGADDGIGMAMIMAILQSKTLKTPPLEALFTVDEETSMSGALGLQPTELKGRTYINLDSENEGVFTIGSAGGEDVDIDADYPQTAAPEDMVSYQVKVSGLQGGHSGLHINKGRGHATKLLVRLLEGALDPYGLRIASFAGGTAKNAIPTEAGAIVFLPESEMDAFTKYAQDYEATIQAELAATEPDLKVSLEAVEPPTQVMEESFQKIFIHAVYGTPQGVLRMSDGVPGLVETSTNLGITSAQDGKLTISSFPRSSVNSELTDAAQMNVSVWDLAGYTAETSNYFSSWPPNPDSPLLAFMETTYQDLYARDPQVEAIHAGLECGAVSGIFPDMDMISIGPTLADVHALNESLYIPSVGKVMNLLTETLENIPAAQE